MNSGFNRIKENAANQIVQEERDPTKVWQKTFGPFFENWNNFKNIYSRLMVQHSIDCSCQAQFEFLQQRTKFVKFWCSQGNWKKWTFFPRDLRLSKFQLRFVLYPSFNCKKDFALCPLPKKLQMFEVPLLLKLESRHSFKFIQIHSFCAFEKMQKCSSS